MDNNQIQCPRCKTPLIKDFFEKKINYTCPNCHGRIMSLAGLRAICESKQFPNMLWQTAQYGVSQEGVTCHSCNKKMRRLTLPLDNMVFELDVCCCCQLIWFDQNELENIPIVKEKTIEKLPQQAIEKLALIEIEHIEENMSSTSKHSPDNEWKILIAYLGFPVETNSSPCSRWAFITHLIAVICIVVYIFSFKNLDMIIQNWGFITEYWSRHYLLTIITSQFLHAGIWHLLSNVYFLLIFGDNVEDFLGHKKYIFLIIASGLMALFSHVLFDGRSTIPLVGASGFISGIIACYAVLFPKVRISFMICQNLLYMMLLKERNWFSIPAWGAIIFWIVLQVVLAAKVSNNHGGTAYIAHISGAILGLIFGFYYRKKQKAQLL